MAANEIHLKELVSVKFRRILFSIALFTLVIISIPFSVFAEAANSHEGYLNWEYLGTYSGVVAAVVMIVQFLKLPLGKLLNIPTRYFVWFISFLLLLAIEIFTNGLEMQKLVLLFLNSIVVSMAALGSYEVTIKKLKSRQKSRDHK